VPQPLLVFESWSHEKRPSFLHVHQLPQPRE